MNDPTRDLDRQYELLLKFNRIVSVVSVLEIAVLAFVCAREGVHSALWLLFLVAIGGFGLGTLGGFLFATFGEEKERFAQGLVVANGLVGGFALADLSKDTSVVRAFFQSIAEIVGLPGGGAIVAFVAVGFGSIGFLLLYTNKKLILNPYTTLSDRIANAKEILLGRDTGISEAEPGERPKPVDPDVARAAETVLRDVPGAQDDSPDTQKAYAKALYLKGDVSKAAEVLQRIISSKPKDTEALLYLGQALLQNSEPLKAIPVLETLSKLPKAPLLTWKLLGYAYLFDKASLENARQATERYLQAQPDDPGALINLACVYGQRGPEDQGNRERVLDLLGRVFRADPAWRGRVLELTKPGEDFEKWSDDPAFMDLVTPGRGRPNRG